MDKELKETVDVYDQIAADYAEYTLQKITQFQLNEFVSFLPKGAKVLDIGCGAGRDVSYMCEDGVDVLGIDASKKLIDEAKKRFPDCKFEVADMNAMPFDDGSFDGIWCHETLCHCFKKNVHVLLKEFSRVLKKEGVLYIALREGEGEGMLMYPKSGNMQRFFAFYKMDELVEILKKAGFKILKAYVENDGTHDWLNVFAKKE